jgi:signal transduction histidine kinase
MSGGWGNWRNLMTLVAIAIVVATIFYSRYLAGRIAVEERSKVEAWAEAQRFIARATPDQDLIFASILVAGQNSIPVIETDERDSITDHFNLDSAKVASDPRYLNGKLRDFAGLNPPIVTYLDSSYQTFNRYYYGESSLLRQVRYYPFVQLGIVALFIAVSLLAWEGRHRAEQDRLWTALAKETAHQLGTPLTALEGWMQMLREAPPDKEMLTEMGKDIDRLKLVSERFSRIGGRPKLEESDLVSLVGRVLDYIRKRAPSRVAFVLDAGALSELRASVSPPLFEWVVENILRNSLDSMEGEGRIDIRIQKTGGFACVDIADTGKGIPGNVRERIFQPGFTTKKRGWGLGLTLSKRIVEQYHRGQLSVVQSEPGKGTTFRIQIPL